MSSKDPRRWLAFVLGLAGLVAACSTRSAPPPAPPGTSQPEASPPAPEEPLEVANVAQELVVAAWAEPPQLPPGGGDVQILIRVQKRGGAPFPGVEVRLRASAGVLYSGGRILTTDHSGMTRDRITASKNVVITLNAGGTRYSFRVPVAPKPD